MSESESDASSMPPSGSDSDAVHDDGYSDNPYSDDDGAQYSDEEGAAVHDSAVASGGAGGRSGAAAVAPAASWEWRDSGGVGWTPFHSGEAAELEGRAVEAASGRGGVVVKMLLGGAVCEVSLADMTLTLKSGEKRLLRRTGTELLASDGAGRAAASKTSVFWECFAHGSDEWLPFDELVAAKLEAAYSCGRAAAPVRVSSGGSEFMIDTRSYTKTNLETKETVTIRRRVEHDALDATEGDSDGRALPTGFLKAKHDVDLADVLWSGTVRAPPIDEVGAGEVTEASLARKTQWVEAPDDGHDLSHLKQQKCAICLMHFLDGDSDEEEDGDAEDAVAEPEPPAEEELRQVVRMSRCFGHYFHKPCLLLSMKARAQCPVCMQIYGVIRGTQPDGTMSVRRVESSVPGYPGCGMLVIQYQFPRGIQGEHHPNPGKPYRGATRTAYLPDCPEGRKVLSLLRTAFDRRLVFEIGTSITDGVDNATRWAGIHHKTAPSGSAYSYPDPHYLARVTEELAAKGVKWE